MMSVNKLEMIMYKCKISGIKNSYNELWTKLLDNDFISKSIIKYKTSVLLIIINWSESFQDRILAKICFLFKLNLKRKFKRKNFMF